MENKGKNYQKGGERVEYETRQNDDQFKQLQQENDKKDLPKKSLYEAFMLKKQQEKIDDYNFESKYDEEKNKRQNKNYNKDSQKANYQSQNDNRRNKQQYQNNQISNNEQTYQQQTSFQKNYQNETQNKIINYQNEKNVQKQFQQNSHHKKIHKNAINNDNDYSRNLTIQKKNLNNQNQNYKQNQDQQFENQKEFQIPSNNQNQTVVQNQDRQSNNQRGYQRKPKPQTQDLDQDDQNMQQNTNSQPNNQKGYQRKPKPQTQDLDQDDQNLQQNQNSQPKYKKVNQRKLDPHFQDEDNQNFEQNQQKQSYKQRGNQRTEFIQDSGQEEYPQKSKNRYERKQQNSYNIEQVSQELEQPKSKINDHRQKYKQEQKNNDCPICVQTIHNQASIWSCKQCHHPFHLNCIRKWVHNCNKNPQKNQKIYMWTCPNCCYHYSEELPDYYCYCGKVQNPDYDKFLAPHSCGEVCQKLRGINCPHPCDQLCHPGPCKPCNKIGKQVKCYCGKQKRDVLCSENLEFFSCNQICGKKLSCGNHYCQKPCHSGPCDECLETSWVSCFCQKIEKTVKCGQEKLSCKQKCMKLLDCGNHYCQQLCHEGDCNQCSLKPDIVKKCPCGQTSLSYLTSEKRNKCTDPIETCDKICNKLLKCGQHYCNKKCHQGECSPCEHIVQQECQCGRTSQKIECHKVNCDDPQPFKCFKICKKKKSCGVHTCQEECCPVKHKYDSSGLHLCLKICDKPLSCGLHKCELFCHLGVCQKCPIYINNPISCVCGKTTLQAPLPCGTQPPQCHEPCSRQRDCGHKCHLECHQDACPECFEQVSKICRCGQNKVENVPCSRDALCQDRCKEILPCGHQCPEICHKASLHQNDLNIQCQQRCFKEKSCGHRCLDICHPGKECNKVCDIEVKITCQCGVRQAFIPCSGSKSKELKCDKQCANYKRFGDLFDKESSQKPYYPSLLLRFAKLQHAFLLKLETKIQEMIKNGDNYLDIPLKQGDTLRKNSLQQLLTRNYNAEIDTYYNTKNPFITIRNNEKLILPKPSLSEYLKQVESGKIKPDILPFEASIRFINLSKMDNIDDLEQILKEYQGQYYIERANQKTLMLHFWLEQYAQYAAKKLKKSLGGFNNFIIDINHKMKDQDETQINLLKDIKQIENKVESDKNKDQDIELSLENKQQILQDEVLDDGFIMITHY